MAIRDVNQRQREVLEWVAAGRPERTWPDETHKHSARALATRGLVRVFRQSGRWAAELTDDGKYFHQHGEYPAGHRFGPKPPDPIVATEARTPAKAVSNRATPAALGDEVPSDWAIDSPVRLKRRGKGVLGSGVITMARQIGFVVGVSTLFALVGDNVGAAAMDGLRQTWLVAAVVLLIAGAAAVGMRSRGALVRGA